MVASLRDDRPAFLGTWLVAVHCFITAFSTYVAIRDVVQATENSSTVIFMLWLLSIVSLLIALLPCGLLLLYFLNPSRNPKRDKLVASAFFIMAVTHFISLVLNLSDGETAVDLSTVAYPVAYALVFITVGIDALVHFKWQYLSTILLCLRALAAFVLHGESVYSLFISGADVLSALGNMLTALLLPVALVLLSISFKREERGR